MNWHKKIGQAELETITGIRNGRTLHLNPLATIAIRQMADLLDEIETTLTSDNWDEELAGEARKILRCGDE